MKFKNEVIWIVGASSGIGAALAEALDQEGAKLILSARTRPALEQLNNKLGSRHTVAELDCASPHSVAKVAHAIKEHQGKIDRVIFMAAIYRPNNIDKLDMNFARQLVEINLLGAIYATYSVLPIMKEQDKGQIVLCGSVAGYTGLPGGQPYSATKAAIINFAESLYAEVEPHIDVKVINPGFVRTRITDKNRFHMPARQEPEQAAQAIVKGLNKSAFQIHFPKRFTYMVRMLHLLPYWIKLRITRRLRGRA